MLKFKDYKKKNYIDKEPHNVNLSFYNFDNGKKQNFWSWT
jgi:hypothetical protein